MNISAKTSKNKGQAISELVVLVSFAFGFSAGLLALNTYSNQRIQELQNLRANNTNPNKALFRENLENAPKSFESLNKRTHKEKKTDFSTHP